MVAKVLSTTPLVEGVVLLETIRKRKDHCWYFKIFY